MKRLSGRVVATTREGAPADPLKQLLESEGAKVVDWPTLRFEEPSDPAAVERARAALETGAFDWAVVTSARAVPALGRAEGVPERVRVGAVGSATAEALRGAGWRVDVTGDGDVHDLVKALQGAFDLGGTRVLFPAASLAGSALEDELAISGAKVVRVEAYRTVMSPPDAARVRRDLAAGVDVVAFASPSAVASLKEALGEAWPHALSGVGVASIGPSTARALVEGGLDAGRIATADPPSLEGLVEACVTSIESTKRKGP